MNSAGGAGSDQCPLDEELSAFKHKTLEPLARERVQTHLKTCKNCQKRLTQIVISGIREANRQADSSISQGPKSAVPPAKPPEPATQIMQSKPAGAAPEPRKPQPAPPKSSSQQTSQAKDGVPDHPPDEYPYLDPPEEPGEMARLGMYNIHRVLGSGGMGVVFDAIDRRLNRRVALKVLRPELADDSYVERFKQEARLAASLSDEHIVTIFEVGVSANVPFMAMEYLNGEPLDARLSRDGWLPVEEALNILKQAAQGLATAHKAGLVHRDIKPANLWLEKNKETGQFRRVKVLDFGLAKEVAKDSSLTASGMIVGTPSYMAPEQVYGLPCDQRTDLFALGCVLYRMVTGKLPFAGEDTMAVLQNTVDEPMPDLVNTGRSIPKKVLELLKRLLAKEPDARPANASLVVQQINSILGGGEIPVDPAMGSYPKSTQMPAKAIANKRHSSVLAWVSGIMASLAVLISILLFLFYRQPAKPDDNNANGGQVVPEFTGEPIKVGVLFSRSGPFEVDELPLADAVRLAVEEVNLGQLDKDDKPGIDGRKVELVRADGASNPTVFAAEARRLVEKEGCRVIFGCWTSSCRKAVIEVLEEQAKKGRDCLLFYPMQFEGLEDSRQAVYLGMIPNQQIERSLSFVRKELLPAGPRKLFLVGSDYVYPRAAFEVLRLFLQTRFKGEFELVGEEYVPLKNAALAEDAAKKALAAKPDLILNALNGQRVNERFFGAIRKGLQSGTTGDAKKVPILSLSLTERDLEKSEDPSLFEGHFLVWSYLSSIAGPENQHFRKICKEKLTPATVPYDPLEAAYYGVRLWAASEEFVLAQESKAKKEGIAPKFSGLDGLRKALEAKSELSPQGRLDPLPAISAPASLYTPHRPRFGRVLKDREIEVLGAQLNEIQADPFPGPEKPEEANEADHKAAKAGWGRYLESLKKAYGGQWENQGREPATVPPADWWKKK